MDLCTVHYVGEDTGGGGGGTSDPWYGEPRDPCAETGPIQRLSQVEPCDGSSGWVPVGVGIAYEEGTTDITILDNENLAWEDETGFENLPLQTKPSWSTFYSNFPKISTTVGDIEMPSKQVYELIGGKVLEMFNSKNPNACALRSIKSIKLFGN